MRHRTFEGDADMSDEVQTETDPLLDTDYVAWNIIGCTANWLERLRCQGRGPEYLKIGRLIRYRKSAIDAWLAENTIPRKQIPKGGESHRKKRRPQPVGAS
jgi:predicted DNA-binding transcriptional regulator AlpA